MTAFAIDVSNVNPITLRQALAAKALGARVLIAKATEGSTFRDDTLATHRAIAHKANLKFGTYLFLHAHDAGNEAEEFLAYAKPQHGEFVVIDSEAGGEDGLGVNALARRTLACAQALQAKGFDPILYTSSSLWEQFVKCEPALKKLRVWEAQYPGRFTRWFPYIARLRVKLGSGASVVLWQWTDEFSVAGGRFDCSRVFVRVSNL